MIFDIANFNLIQIPGILAILAVLYLFHKYELGDILVATFEDQNEKFKEWPYKDYVLVLAVVILINIAVFYTRGIVQQGWYVHLPTKTVSAEVFNTTLRIPGVSP